MGKSYFEKTAVKVSVVSILGNTLLSLFKLIAGIVGHSGAMISDAVHSASDVFSSIIVMVGVKIASKESDKEHPYGHERMECVAAIILSTILAVTGLGIGYSAVQDIFAGNHASNAVIPAFLAFVAAIISIIVKEAMYWYTRYYGKKLDSGALMADAWHHRTDALSSVGALIGIWFARRGFPIMDAVASVVICVFILVAAYDIFKDAIDKMVDKACDDETENLIRDCALSQKGVLGIDLLQTRVFANKIYVDMEILADGNMMLKDTHAIAEAVHDAIEANIPKVKHIMIHVNPK